MLFDLWELGPSEVISVVGAGGKSTLLECLAREYERRGGRVILTTTTKIMPPRSGGRPLVTGDSLEKIMDGLDRLDAAWERSAPPCAPAAPAPAGPASPMVGLRVLDNGKLDGLPPDWIAALRDRPGVDCVVVEADGAARMPLKAPAAYEPVVPACTSLMVAMCGLEAQRAYLEPDQVHRPERLADLLDLPLGSPVPPERLPEALVLGYQDAVPPWARFLLLFNKADLIPPDPALLEAARCAPVESWLGGVGARPVPLLQCLRARDPAPAIVILAAGRATRMGGCSKVLLQMEGRTLLARALGAARAVDDAGPLVVVTGHEAALVEAQLEREVGRAAQAGYTVVRNPHPEEGMGSSLRRGTQAAGPRDVVVLLGDQPFVTAATLGRLLAAFRARPNAAGAVMETEPGGEGVKGAWGPPLVIHRSLAPQLASLAGADGGGRGLLKRYERDLLRVPAVGREAVDIDTQEDWAGLSRAES